MSWHKTFNLFSACGASVDAQLIVGGDNSAISAMFDYNCLMFVSVGSFSTVPVVSRRCLLTKLCGVTSSAVCAVSVFTFVNVRPLQIFQFPRQFSFAI